MTAYPSDSNLTSLATLKSYLEPAPLSGIASVTVDTHGTGYTSATGSIVDATGTGATLGPAVISGGTVVSFPILTRGQNYLNPTLVITGDGAGAAGTAGVGADTILSGLITRASALIVQATNRRAIYDSGTNIIEKRNGNGKDRIVPRVWPIVGVTSVAIGTTTLTLSNGNSIGFLFDEDIIYLIGAILPRIPQYVTLTYRGGFAVGSSAAAMLEHACITTCALWWKRRPHVDYMSESVNQGLGTHSYVQADLPPEAWTAINQIKNVAPILE